MKRTPVLALLLGLAVLTAPAVRAAEGVVRKLQPEQAKVTLAHGEIKELDMPAMTMAYRAQPPSLLDGLAVGDRVEFSAAKVDGQYVVTAIRKKK